MNESELIARQALRIATLEQRLDDSDQRLDRIHQMLVGIGGPLNDNVLGFDQPQRRLLFKIDEHATLGLHPSEGSKHG